MTREGVGWAVITFVMLVAGLLKTINLLVLLGYTMLALLGLNAWLAWRAGNRVATRRVAADPPFAGRRFDRTFVVENTADKPASVGVVELSAAHAADVFVPGLPPGGSRPASAPLTATRRGRFPTSPLAVTSGYPFGLVSYTVPVAPGDVLTVLPAIGQVDVGMLRVWLIRTGAGDANARRPVRRAAAQQADVRGVRDYRPGDGLRDIHWKTTARRNELVVREYDHTEPLDLLLVVEPWLPAEATVQQLDRLEQAISLAASVVWAWCHQDEPSTVVVAVAGSGESATGKASSRFAHEALMALAAADGSPSPGGVPSRALHLRSNRSARIVVSSRPVSPLADELRRTTGVPFVRLDPTTPVAWYSPPAPGNGSGTQHSALSTQH